MLTAEVSGGRLQSKPRLGWMDGGKAALGNRGMTVEVARQCAQDTIEWRALVHVTELVSHCHLLGPVLRTALPSSGGYHLERGGMPLHAAVGRNCEKGATTENQGPCVKYMG